MRSRYNNGLLPIILLIGFMITAVAATALLLTDFTKPSAYNLLFLLPVCFIAVSFLFWRLYFKIPSNLGITIILLLIFTRLVLTPLMLYLGGYKADIMMGLDNNVTPAILLICYETFVVYLALYMEVQKEESKDSISVSELVLRDPKRKYTYLFVIVVICLMLLLCYSVAPQFMLAYRTIFQIGSENFTAFEDSQINDMYATSFLIKFALVTGQYIFRVALLIIPGYFVISLSKFKFKLWRKILSLAICFVPCLFISGTIARSLIYTMTLLIARNYAFKNSQQDKWLTRIIVNGAIMIIAWWTIIGGVDYRDLGATFNSYFSGVNIVSGVFNLPRDISLRIRYFLNDFIGTVPYGTTIFTINYESIGTFFGSNNYTRGQIVPTISMGYYIFGPFLAPVYSFIFAKVAYRIGYKLDHQHFSNPFQCTRLVLTVFYFSLGIVMYNINITMTNLFTLLLPMYLLEVLAYGRYRYDNGRNALGEPDENSF